VIGKDEFMGEFTVNVADIPSGNSSQNYTLHPNVHNKAKKGKVSGTIQLEFQLKK